MRSDYRLKQLYRKFNKQWFGGKMRDDVIVRWATGPADLKRECQAKKLLACADDKTIILNPWMKKSGNLTRFTLLHEMVHAKLPQGVHHGPRFQREMHRLARAGAFEKYW